MLQVPEYFHFNDLFCEQDLELSLSLKTVLPLRLVFEEKYQHLYNITASYGRDMQWR